MVKSPFGVWECYVEPEVLGICAIPHDSMLKISMTLPSGHMIDRIPTWLTRVTQDLNVSPLYDGRFWNPPKEEIYHFRHGHSKNGVDDLKIYEAHGGWSRETKFRLIPRSGHFQSSSTRYYVQRVRDGCAPQNKKAGLQLYPDVSAVDTCSKS